MKRARVSVAEHDGSVELSVCLGDDDEATVIVLDGQTARQLGSDMFKCGAATGF